MASGVQTWSQVAATNATADTNINFAEGQAPSSLNDSCRAIMSSVARFRDDNNGTIVTAGTSIAFTAATNQVEAALTAGYTVKLQFNQTADVAATLAVDGLAAKPLQLYPGQALVGQEFPSGSIQGFTYSTTGTGQWIANGFTRPVLTAITNSLSGDISFSSTSVYTDGPSVAQGSSGIWYASGTVSLLTTLATFAHYVKLWDGTSVIASAASVNAIGNTVLAISVSGYITNPAGNIKISCVNQSPSQVSMVFNYSGNSKDCTLTAVRIG